MTEFVSEVKTLSAPNEKVYEMLSDLRNLEKVKDKIPADKIKDLSFDQDSCSFSISAVGKITFSVVNREPFKTIKFTAEGSPVEVNMWIQLLPAGDAETKMKISVKVNLNPFLKPMLSKPIQEGVDRLADVLTYVQYE